MPGAEGSRGPTCEIPDRRCEYAGTDYLNRFGGLDHDDPSHSLGTAVPNTTAPSMLKVADVVNARAGVAPHGDECCDRIGGVMQGRWCR